LLPLGALEVLLGLAVLLFATLLEIVVALGRHGFLVVEVTARGGDRGPMKAISRDSGPAITGATLVGVCAEMALDCIHAARLEHDVRVSVAN
jgi:hypothetical protein